MALTDSPGGSDATKPPTLFQYVALRTPHRSAPRNILHILLLVWLAFLPDARVTNDSVMRVVGSILLAMWDARCAGSTLIYICVACGFPYAYTPTHTLFLVVFLGAAVFIMAITALNDTSSLGLVGALLDKVGYFFCVIFGASLFQFSPFAWSMAGELGTDFALLFSTH